MCNHERQKLMGTANGILCRGCGRVFASFAEIKGNTAPKAETPTEAQEKPKRTRKKKEAAQDA